MLFAQVGVFTTEETKVEMIQCTLKVLLDGIVAWLVYITQTH